MVQIFKVIYKCRTHPKLPKSEEIRKGIKQCEILKTNSYCYGKKQPEIMK